MVDFVLIVVSYRSASDLARLLATVPNAVAGRSWHAVIVNNDPSEDLADVAAAYPQTQVVQAGANLGYAGGINLGLATAPKSTWTVFLNPDLRLGLGALATMASDADDEHAVVPAIVDGDGAVQPSLRREPSLLGSLGDALLGSAWRRRPSWLSETIYAAVAYERPGWVDWATGAALLVPTPLAVEVGEWDARFFLYSEETDYCRRLRAAGTRIRFLPNAVVSHRGGGSGRSDALYALLEVNRIRYFRKWHSPLAATVFAAVVVSNNLLRCSRPRSRAALRALLWPPARAELPGGGR